MLIDIIVVATVCVVLNDVIDVSKDRVKNNFLQNLLYKHQRIDHEIRSVLQRNLP
jgi:hypothetical protein